MNIYGVRGFLTPDSLPVDDHCRTFAIPNDVQWLSVFMGALLPLIYPENWQQFGSLTPDESAEVMLNVIWDAYENDLGICQELGAPYWDTTANVDDEFPDDPLGFTAFDVPTVWFGELKVIDGNLTWVENLFIWAVAGFIAYAGQPAAAIAFVPFAQRFVLAFKAHDLGGIVRVFVDGELVDLIDTYQPSASIIRRSIFTDNSGEPHDLWVEMSEDVNPEVVGEPFIQVVRKELSESEVSPPNVRYYPPGDVVQSDYDGDDVWQDNAPLDVRHNPGMLFPPIGGDDPRCQAAANMTRWISDFLNDVGATLAWATVAESSLTTIMGLVAVVFPEGAAIGLFALLGLDLATTIFSAGLTAIQAAFDNDTLDLMTCIFFCAIESNGQVSADDLATINAEIDGQLNTLAALVLHGMFLLMGEIGLSNAGSTGDAPADCDGCDCGWCALLDDTYHLADFEPLGWADQQVTLPSYSGGIWHNGEVHNGVNGAGHNVTYIHLLYTFAEETEIDFTSTLEPERFDLGIGWGLYANSDGTIFSGTKIFGAGGGVNLPIMATNISVLIFIVDTLAPLTFESTQLSGIGDNPFGENNC